MLHGAALVRGLVAIVLLAGVTRTVSAQTIPTIAQDPLAGSATGLDPLHVKALPKIGALAKGRIRRLAERSRVIVSFADGASATAAAPIVSRLGSTMKRSLPLLNAKVLDLPNGALVELAADPSSLPDGQGIQWGVICATEDCAAPERWSPWGAAQAGPTNVVWGIRCGGADCPGGWSVAAAVDESVVRGTSDAESVVWGSSEDDESVVWGTTCGDAACLPVVWGRP